MPFYAFVHDRRGSSFRERWFEIEAPNEEEALKLAARHARSEWWYDRKNPKHILRSMGVVLERNGEKTEEFWRLLEENRRKDESEVHPMCGGGNLPDPCGRDGGGTLPLPDNCPGSSGTDPDGRGPGGGGGPTPDERPAPGERHLRLVK